MKIFCIGRNYREHIDELKNEVPKEPVIFLKPKSALARNEIAIPFPSFTDDLHYESEVVIKIKKNGKNISKESAHQYYNQWTLGIDFTARDLQTNLKKKGLPWEISKGFDNSAYLGEFMDITADKQNTNFEFYVNDELAQKGNTKDMIFDFDDIIHHISQYFSIQIGDVIFTGTPAGVGSLLPFDEMRGVLNGKEVFQNIIK